MPTLTVASPAASKLLATVAQLKADLGITDASADSLIETWLGDASARICSYCGVAADQLGRRAFAAETCIVTFRAEEVPERSLEPLILPWRVPVTAIASVVEDGTTLAADDYEVEPMTGLLYRLDDDDERTSWDRAKIVVTLTAGWDVASDAHPAELRQACIELVKARWYARTRDPLVKSVDVQDVAATTYWVGSAPGDGMPSEVADLLNAAGVVNRAVF